jgi:dGTPase
VQSEEIGGAMLALRAFMFERVYLGPHTRQEQERARATVRHIFEHLADRGDEPEEIIEFIAGMTDRFALSYVAELEF